MTSTEILNKVYNKDTKSFDVALQDQHSKILDVYMYNFLNAVYLTAPLEVGQRNITLQPGHNFTGGDVLRLIDDETGSYYQGEVVNVATDVITVDAPIDRVYGKGCTAERVNKNLNVNGATTNVIYKIQPPRKIKIDVTRILIAIRDGTDMDDGKFGGATALTNGILLRHKFNGWYRNIFTAKTNSALKSRFEKFEYSTKAPSGEYGLCAMKTFSGQENSGCAIRLDGDKNEQLQLIVQDDLSVLTYFRVVAQGHTVED